MFFFEKTIIENIENIDNLFNINNINIKKNIKKNKKKVSFNNIISVILIPSRNELSYSEIFDLYYQERDYKRFIQTYHYFKNKDLQEELLYEEIMINM
tara:strand:- start:1128 stop:1421 length:294 start_codon:yes stop_codon:yes gene_type:complete